MKVTPVEKVGVLATIAGALLFIDGAVHYQSYNHLTDFNIFGGKFLRTFFNLLVGWIATVGGIALPWFYLQKKNKD